MTRTVIFNEGEQLPAAKLNSAFDEVVNLTAQEADAAAASAAAAAASAITAKGVITLTGVGGSVDGDGRCLNYTASSTVTPAADMIFAIVWHANNAALPTLAVNGGTARAVRASDGTVLAQDTARANAWTLLRYTASNQFQMIKDDTLYAASAQFRAAGTINVNFYAGAEAEPRSQMQWFSDGSMRLRLGGDGVAIPPNIVDFEDTGDIRMRAGQFRDIQNYPVYSLSNPPPFQQEHQTYVEAFPGRRDEATGRGLFVNWSDPYAISGPDHGQFVTVNNGAAWLDFSAMQPETECYVETTATGACTLWGGSLGVLWVGGGAQRGMSANSLVRVIRGRDTLRAIALDGTLTTPTLSIPTYGRGMVMMGQSWAVRGSRNCLYGMQRRYSTMGLNRSIWSIHDAAVGASSFVEGGATVSTNYWWQQSTGLPGPNAIIARDKILASSRAPDFGVFIIGGNEYPALLPNVGGVSPTEWAGYFRDFRDWLATEIGNSSFRIFICPMGAQEPKGTIDESAIYALRYAQLHACTLSSYIHRGPDWYDIPRPDGIHMSWAGAAVHGERIAAYVANVMEGQSNMLLPTVTAFARTAAKTYQFTINRGTGTPPFTRPANPIGFGVLSNGDLLGEPLTITDMAWSGDNVIVYTATDDAAAIGAYPYGNFDDAKQTSRLVRNYDAATERWQALATYHPSV